MTVLLPAALLALPVLEAALVGRAVRAWAPRTHPATATWMVSVLAVGSALTSAGALAVVLAWAVEGHVLDAGEHRVGPAPGELAFAFMVGVALLHVGAAATVVSVRAARESRRARRGCTGLRVHPGGIIVREDADPDAYALPGRRPLIVVHTGMLDALPRSEWPALLAHERAHLDRHHGWHRRVAAISAAVNPLLRPLDAQSGRQVERWADEVAADVTGSRSQVARAVARAALARTTASVTAQLAVANGAVAARTDALLVPPPPRRRAAVLVCSVLVLALGAVTLPFANGVEDRYEQLSREAVSREPASDVPLVDSVGRAGPPPADYYSHL